MRIARVLKLLPEGFACAAAALQGALCPPHFRDEATGSDRFEELAQACAEPGVASQDLKPEQPPLLLNDQPQDPEVWGKGLATCPRALVREWAAHLTPCP